MVRNKSVRRLIWLATVSSFANLGPAFAQADPAVETAAAQDAGGLEDIIVTARKRSESLIAAPVSVTAIGAADLSRYNASDLTRIGQLAPQLSITRSPSGAGATFNIRGIGSSPLEPGLDQSVSINLDGVQLSRGRFISLGMFDLAQVEVLKGPQALFFGKNSPAGVVSLTTNGPTDSFEASVTGGYEFIADEKYLEFAVSGPLTDTLGARFAFRGSEMNGWMRNHATAMDDPFKPGMPTPGALTQRLPEGSNVAGRLTLAYDPGTAFEATLKLGYGQERFKTMTGSQEPYCLPGVQVTQYGVPDPYTECGFNRALAQSAYNPGAAVNYPGANGGRPYSKTDILLTSLNMTYEMDTISISSVTGYGSLVFNGFDNFSWSNLPQIVANNNESTRTFSQEVRVESEFDSPLNFMVGLYFEDVKRHDYARPMLFFSGSDTRTGEQYSFLRDAQNHNNAISGFGQLRWNIAENIELAGGARWTREVKKLEIVNQFINNQTAFNLNPEGELVTGRYSDTNWSPEATLSWHPTPDSTFYAAYKTGYKSGGFTNPLIFSPVTSADDISFSPESAKGGEIGYKAKLLDNRLRIELGAYWYTFDGLQLSAFDAETVSYYVKNAGRARTRGLELSAEWKASDELLLRTGAGYNQARYLSFPTASCYQTQTIEQGCIDGNRQDLAGRRMTRAPDFVGSVGFSYDTALSDSLMIGLDSDLRYSSSYNVDEALTPYVNMGAYALLNGSVRLYSSDDSWQFSLIGRNLTNKNYYNFAQDAPGATPGTWIVQIERPREIALQAQLRF